MDGCESEEEKEALSEKVRPCAAIAVVSALPHKYTNPWAARLIFGHAVESFLR